MAKPEIRLKGFEGEWKECPLGDISTSFSGGTPSAGVAKYYGGNIPFIRSGEIAGDKTQLFITEEGLDASSARIVEKGTLLYALYGATSGEVSISKIDGAINQAILAIYPKKGYSTKYLSHYLRSKKDNIVSTLLQGGQGNLSGALVKSINVNLPETSEEQDAIANYLDSMDTLIQSTTKKIVSLKQMKQACLVSMFPQAGETTPRVRFKGFEGEWEKKLLGELYEPSSIKNKIYGADKIISVANMYFKPVSYISDDEYLKSYNVMSLGDIAFEGNKSKNFAHGRFVENTIGDGIVSHVFVVLKPISKKYDLQFWKYYINYERIMGPILQRCTKHSTMMTDIVVADFLKESILVPSYEEQKKIGTFFEILDKQISLQEKRLEKLKQIKAACLDKMFV